MHNSITTYDSVEQNLNPKHFNKIKQSLKPSELLLDIIIILILQVHII